MDRPAQGPRIVGVSDINFNLFIANFSRSIYGTPQFVISINTTHTHTQRLHMRAATVFLSFTL